MSASDAERFDSLCMEFTRLEELATEGFHDALTPLVEVGEQLLKMVTDENRAYVLHVLGLAYITLFGSEEDGNSSFRYLDRAIVLLRELRTLLPENDPDAGPTALWLGLVLTQRLGRVGTADTRTEAIDALTRGLDTTPSADRGPVLEARLQLGHLLALRHFSREGEPEDRTRAITSLTAVLDSAEVPPEIANGVRLTLAHLELAGTQNIDARTDTRTFDTAAGVAALQHLNAISDVAATGFSQGEIALLRSTAKLVSDPSGDPLTPDEISASITALEDTLQNQAPDSPEAALLVAFRTALELQHGRRTGNEEGNVKQLDAILDALDNLGDHHYRSLVIETLGFATDMPISASATLATGSMQRLERVSHALRGHRSRTRTVTRLATGVLLRALSERDIVTVRGLHAVLTAARTWPNASDIDETFRTLQLGLTNATTGLLEGRAEDMDAALALVDETATRLPEDHEARAVLGPYVAMLLLQRYEVGRSLEDVDAVSYLGRTYEPPSGTPDSDARRSLDLWQSQVQPIMVDLLRPGGMESPEQVDTLIAGLDEAVTRATGAERSTYGLDRFTRFLKMIRSSHDGDHFDFPRFGSNVADFRAEGEAFLAGAGPTEGSVPPVTSAQNAWIQLGVGFSSRNLPLLDQGLATFAELCDSPDQTVRDRVLNLEALGVGFRMRHMLSRKRADLEHAITRFEDARLVARTEPGLADATSSPYLLGECYFTRRDRNRHDLRRAVSSGLDGLAARTLEVLIQTSPARAMDAARAADGEAVEVMFWCVAAGDHEAAVRALELGRAMVLRSATAEADVPGLLRDAGRAELASRWEEDLTREAPWDRREPTAAHDVHGVRMPSTVRRETIREFRGTATERRLLSSPSITEIAAALCESGSTALVYLVANDNPVGLGLVVRANGDVHELRLPGLHTRSAGVVRGFEQAQQDLQEEADETAVRQRWAAAASAISEWAWTTAMEPVLGTILPADRHPARLVLVPIGRLGAVPWHSARREVTGGVRYACQDAAISYAASARQFVDAHRLPPRPWASAPAVVSVADTETPLDTLFWVEEEADELKRCYYPLASDAGHQVLPSDIAALLPGRDSPGVSMLHLSCHAVRVDPPVESYLRLANGTRLPVGKILRQAANRPADTAGALVVLAACATDLAGSLHDEALTLATAFLTGGAAGVVGARWPVPDLPTALFMIMFHHYLSSGYPDPAIALRATQLWMLDPNRRLPPGVGRLLADEVSRHPLDDLGNWAAFTYQGR